MDLYSVDSELRLKVKLDRMHSRLLCGYRRLSGQIKHSGHRMPGNTGGRTNVEGSVYRQHSEHRMLG